MDLEESIDDVGEDSKVGMSVEHAALLSLLVFGYKLEARFHVSSDEVCLQGGICAILHLNHEVDGHESLASVDKCIDGFLGEHV